MVSLRRLRSMLGRIIGNANTVSESVILQHVIGELESTVAMQTLGCRYTIPSAMFGSWIVHRRVMGKEVGKGGEGG